MTTRYEACTKYGVPVFKRTAPRFAARAPGLSACAFAAFAVTFAARAALAAPVTSQSVICVEDEVLRAQLTHVSVGEKAPKYALKSSPSHGQVKLDAATGAFEYTPAKDFHGRDAFTAEAVSGKITAPIEVLVDVTQVNDPPVVTSAVSLKTAEDTPGSASVTARDIDGDALTYQVATPPAHGETAIDPKSGKFTYTPSPDFNGADSFIVEVSDGQVSQSTTIKVMVTPVNDAPKTEAAAMSVDEDGSVEQQLAATDADATKPLAFTVVTKPAHGTLTLSRTGLATYKPSRDYSGQDAFVFEVSDGALSTRANGTIEVKAVNDAPTAQPLALMTAEDVTGKAPVAASDVEKDALTYSIKTGPSHGRATVDARTGMVTYTPAANFNGNDSLVVEVSDGQLSIESKVSAAVTPVNDAPVAKASTASGNEDEKIKGRFEASDLDSASLKYRVVTKPKHGEVTLNGDAYTSAPAHDFHGADSFVFEVTDGALTAQETVSLEIKPVNDAPVAKSIALSGTEDAVLKGSVVGKDVDGDVLSYSVKNPPSHGDASVDPRTGTVIYTPEPNYNGTDKLVVEVSDSSAHTQAEVSVTLAAVNDAPVAQSGSAMVDEDASVQGKTVFSDVENDALAVRLVAKPQHGELTLNDRTGAFTYKPHRDYHGPDSFTFEVADPSSKSAVATMAIDVRSVNDVPVTKPLALSTTEDVPAKGKIIASDADADALHYRVGTAPAHGTSSVDANTGAVSYQPEKDFSGNDAFVIEVTDGIATASAETKVTVAAIGDPPRILANVFEALEDTASEGKLPAVDPDGDKMTFKLITAPKLGEAVLLDAATGAFRYTPRANVNGDDELTFEVSDGSKPVRGVMKIRVAAVNDVPTLAGLELKVEEDRPGEGQLRGADLDHDELTYRVVDQPSIGKVSLDANSGKFHFEAPKDVNGRTSFTAVAVDKAGAKSDPATVFIDIEPQNDAPVAQAASLKTDEDIELRGTLHAADVDGDSLTYRVSRAPLHGTVTVLDAAKGTFLYLPASNHSGSDEFQFTVADPGGLTGSAYVSVAVAAVNDAPVAMADSVTAPANGSVSGRLRGYDRESAKLTFKIIDQPSSGKVKLLDENTGDFVLTTSEVTAPQISFRFVVSDGELRSEPAEVVAVIRSRSL